MSWYRLKWVEGGESGKFILTIQRNRAFMSIFLQCISLVCTSINILCQPFFLQVLLHLSLLLQQMKSSWLLPMLLHLKNLNTVLRWFLQHQVLLPHHLLLCQISLYLWGPLLECLRNQDRCQTMLPWPPLGLPYEMILHMSILILITGYIWLLLLIQQILFIFI